ncbi:MAG: ABC transporter permease, partial [Candidatus Limnocylindria bacterium]
VVMASISLQEGSLGTGYALTWNFGIYPQAISTYSTQFIRSFEYGLIVTVLTLAIGYPMAYTIAFYGGRLKNALLLIVIMPFFVSFVIRTLNWSMVLSDNGLVFGTLKNAGLLDQSFRFLATPAAVIFGLTYNFLPFMVLPLYVALEKIDRRLIEAGADLYASRAQAFWRITFLLSLPGVVAGSLLTFIPAVGDFINADIIGARSPEVAMIGNVIQRLFLNSNDFPSAAALGFVLVAGTMLLVGVYTRLVGTDRLTS